MKYKPIPDIDIYKLLSDFSTMDISYGIGEYTYGPFCWVDIPEEK